MPVSKGRGEGLGAAVEDWQKIALGAGIAILAGPLTEIFRHYLTRAKDRKERQRTFQRDTLIALLDHMTDGEIACSLARDERKKKGWPDEWQIDHASVCFENVMQARRHRLLVDDKQVRDLAGEAIATALESLGAKTVEESDDKAETATDLFFRADERIGEIVRGL